MKLRSIAFLGLSLATSICLAADKDVEAMLKTLRESYKKVKSARFEVQAVLPEAGGDDNPINSTVQYRAPLSFRIVSKAKSMGPSEVLLISDGKQLYSKTPDGKTTKKALNLDEPGAFLNLESLCFWDYKRQLSTDTGANMHDSQLRLLKRETWKDRDFMVLEEKAPKSKVFVRYYIDPKTKLIMRTTVYDLEDTATIRGDYRITKVDQAADIPANATQIPG